MPKTIDDIRRILNNSIRGWHLDPVPALTAEETEKIGASNFVAQAGILVSPDSENILVFFSGTTVTGTERAKPQIRIFTDKIISAYKYSKIHQMRFFCFVLCTSDPAMLKLPTAVMPDEYILSLESSFDRCGSGRIDIRSMYDALENNLDKQFFRLSKGNHSCSSIEQGAFIRISDSLSHVTTNALEQYLTYFDSRPYMLSVKEGTKVVYQPSALFERATQSDSKYPWNMLIHGAPGTGKSNLIEKKLLALKEDLGEDHVVYVRVTFYEDYTYQQFVGGYMPIPIPDMEETIELSSGAQAFNGTIKGEHISYKFVPGPFGDLLANALISKIKNDGIRYILIIEELNRTNAASVFGDIFQLLDRDKGISKYDITVSDAFADYLFKTISKAIADSNIDEFSNITLDSFKKIRLPENLYLWSTMNSADQGVFPLDSAFKRRWSFVYKDINAVAPADANRVTICLSNCTDPSKICTTYYDWNTLRKAINDAILRAGFDEDRCIGYWFFTEEEMCDIETHSTCAVKAYLGDETAQQELETLPDPFMSKLLSYLRLDVFRNIPTNFFAENCKTLSAIRLGMNSFEVNGRTPVGLKDITKLADSAFVIVAPLTEAPTQGNGQ